LEQDILELKQAIAQKAENVEELVEGLSFMDKDTAASVIQSTRKQLKQVKEEQKSLQERMEEKQQEHVSITLPTQQESYKTRTKEKLMAILQDEYLLIGKHIYRTEEHRPVLHDFLDKNRKFKKQFNKLEKSIKYNNRLAVSL